MKSQTVGDFLNGQAFPNDIDGLFESINDGRWRRWKLGSQFLTCASAMKASSQPKLGTMKIRVNNRRTTTVVDKEKKAQSMHRIAGPLFGRPFDAGAPAPPR